MSCRCFVTCVVAAVPLGHVDNLLLCSWCVSGYLITCVVVVVPLDVLIFATCVGVGVVPRGRAGPVLHTVCWCRRLITPQ